MTTSLKLGTQTNGMFQYVVAGLLIICIAGAFSAYVSAKVVESKLSRLCTDQARMQTELKEVNLRLSLLEGRHKGTSE